MRKVARIGFVFLLLTVVLSSCVNLKHVNAFSVSSQKSLEQFENIRYGFKQSCQESCVERKVQNLDLNPEDCHCELNEKADSITFVIYSALKGYMTSLSALSDDKLTTYQLDTLTNKLTESDFGSVKLDQKQVEAYANISSTLLKACTDGYRQKQIKQYVKEANEPLKILIEFLDFNLSKNLSGKLNVQKERIKSHCFDLTKDPSLTPHEKRKAVEAYYDQLADIEAKQQVLLTYSKALKKISQGHQELFDNLDKISKDEVKVQLTLYATEIQGIIAEFNKINKD